MRIAVVTGATGGLGSALLEKLSPLYEKIITIGRRPSPMPDATFLQADLRRPDACKATVASCKAFEAASEIVFFDVAAVLNLGSVGLTNFVESAGEAMTVNAISPLTIGAVLGERAEKQGARLKIIHISTGASTRPIAGWGVYGMTKAAAALGWKTFAAERAYVSLSIIDPGVIDTAMQQQLRERSDPNAASVALLKTPAEAANFILSEACKTV